jgi:hypothetical protein
MDQELTDLEARLQQIYRDVLGLEQIGPADNILDLGGYSMPIMTIVAVIQQELGVGVTVTDVFRAPTITELARILEARLA